MPWARMHSEVRSSWAFACAEACAEGVPPLGSTCRQDFCAAPNAGACGLTPEPLPIEMWMPPPAVLGSGKFDTPWVRMHFENASACE